MPLATRGTPRVRALIVASLAIIASVGVVAAGPMADAHMVKEVNAAEREAALAELLAELRARDDLEADTALHHLLTQQGRHREALAAAERWLQRAETKPHRLEIINALDALARTQVALGDRPAAAARYRQALAVAEEDQRSFEVARLSVALVEQLVHLGELAGAGDLLARAGELAATTDFGQRFTHDLLAARGNLAFQRGDALAAVDLRRAAVQAAEVLDDPAPLAVALANLGRALAQVHDHAAAIEVQRRALELPEARPDRRAIALATLGISHFELNQYAEARARFEEALELARRAEKRAIEGWLEGELGLVAWQAERDEERAVGHFHRAIVLARDSKDPFNEAVWWQNLGRVYRDLDRCAEGLVAYGKAEALRERIGSPEPSLWKHRGMCEAALGRDAEAERLFARALAAAPARGDDKTVWETQREVARLHRRRGANEAARAAYLAALDGIERLRSGLALPQLKVDFLRDKVAVYDETIAFLIDELDDPAAALAVAERARARAFLDLLAESRARVEETLPAAVRLEETALRDEVTRLQAAIRRDGAGPELTSAVAGAEQALEAFQLRVRLEHPVYRALRAPRPAAANELIARLGDGEEMLVYWLGDAASHRWRLSREGVVHQRLAPRQAIEDAVRRAYASLARPGGADDDRDDAARLLLPGIDPNAVPARLLVVPDGILHFLPFEPLPLGDRPTLGDGVQIAYLPAASLLVDLPARAGAGDEPPQLLAVGAPNGAGTQRASRRGGAITQVGQLGSLPQAEPEARAVAARWGREHATLLLGDGATETAMRALPLGAYSVLHFAAHGWLDPSSAARSAIVLEKETDGEDGLLQVREIVALPLAAELVTLSACRSALGELVSGEGVIGITRAFLHAGARDVVASLWAVDDDAAAAFMRHFYRALSGGATTADALARARRQLAADDRFADPYHWAPWILIGRGDAAVRFPPRRGWIAALFVAGAGVAASAWWHLRAKRRAA